MAYQINSAKDASGQEHLFMEMFNRLAPQIQAYKQQRGGDLEGAFQAITGTPWPEGRSVKLGRGGIPEMTKDRTVKSVLGKYVVPIAAGALTAGFGIPALMAGGGAAAAGGGAGAAGAAGATTALPMVGGSVMKNMLMKAGTGALQGGLQGAFQGGLKGGLKGAATGAAGGLTSAIPGMPGKVLDVTGQSGIGGDIMASIMNRGQNEPFNPGQGAVAQQQVQGTQAQGQPRPAGVRPQGW